MKILYLCQVFETGNDAGSERHFYFCKYAVNKGHQATAITSNVDYKNARLKYKGKKGAIIKTVGGIDIHYVYSYANMRGSFLKRFYYYVTYFFSSISEALKVESPDVIYAVSTPLTVGLLGYIISRLRGVPFVFEVTDLWPEAAVECGVVKNKVLIRLAHWLAMFCYNKSEHIVSLGPKGCERIVAKGINSQKVSLITNGVDLSLFNNSNTNNTTRFEIRNKYSFNKRFVAMYMGAHGAYNALDTIIDAASLLRADHRFLFVLIGDGDEKQNLQNRVIDQHLSNVIFLPPMPRLDSPAMLSAADAFVLPNRKGNFFEGNLPNKLFDFLASARPIVVTGAGETPDLVLKAGAGLCGPPEDNRAMADFLLELADMSEDTRLAMGKRGRDYVLSNYDRDILSERFLQILSNAVNGWYPPP
ncbi:MAG: glycosyltransferase family 4 protein [Deltaproteobacteria bacterium]|nr:glycosyltransferase family 4 protein [Deltaproteobacteria bacterium]